MTFYQWLKKQKRRSVPVGDLARDAAIDPNWPCRPASTDPRKVQQACEDYLNSLWVSDDCLKALRRAVGEYETACNKEKA